MHFWSRGSVLAWLNRLGDRDNMALVSASTHMGHPPCLGAESLAGGMSHPRLIHLCTHFPEVSDKHLDLIRPQAVQMLPQTQASKVTSFRQGCWAHPIEPGSVTSDKWAHLSVPCQQSEHKLIRVQANPYEPGFKESLGAEEIGATQVWRQEALLPLEASWWL